MVFVYYAQGVGGLYDEFVERLMSQLALRGTEITHENLGEGRGAMDVKHTDEEGSLEFVVSGRDVKATYQVKRYRREIEKGAIGAVAGGAIGSVIGSLGGLFSKERSIGDVIGGAAGGAVAGGAWQAYQGWDDSKQERTRFAEVLAAAAKTVEDELQYIQQGQDVARDALKEKARAKREQEDGKIADLRNELEDVYGDALALGEELEMLAEEGQTVTKAKAAGRAGAAALRRGRRGDRGRRSHAGPGESEGRPADGRRGPVEHRGVRPRRPGNGPAISTDRVLSVCCHPVDTPVDNH